MQNNKNFVNLLRAWQLSSQVRGLSRPLNLGSCNICYVRPTKMLDRATCAPTQLREICTHLAEDMAREDLRGKTVTLKLKSAATFEVGIPLGAHRTSRGRCWLGREFIWRWSSTPCILILLTCRC